MSEFTNTVSTYTTSCPNMISLLDVVKWTFRRSPADTIRLYNTLSGVMVAATGGASLNFGLWTDDCVEPLLAQDNMARYFGRVASLDTAGVVADVGCGRGGPAKIWCESYPDTSMVGIDVNHLGLAEARHMDFAINALSTSLPLANDSMDRVLALESAQHFSPLSAFVSEAARVLKPGGILCMAIPVAGQRYHISRLGLLWLTWTSEHHRISTIHDVIESAGLHIQREEMVGSMVYVPMADYYMNNRDVLQERITSAYPRYVESILYRSVLDMRRAAIQNVIEYVIVKCAKVLPN